MPRTPEISLRHLPDLSDPSFDLSHASFSFQLPAGVDAADDLLRTTADDFSALLASPPPRARVLTTPAGDVPVDDDEDQTAPAPSRAKAQQLLPTTRFNLPPFSSQETKIPVASRVPKWSPQTITTQENVAAVPPEISLSMKKHSTPPPPSTELFEMKTEKGAVQEMENQLPAEDPLTVAPVEEFPQVASVPTPVTAIHASHPRPVSKKAPRPSIIPAPTIKGLPTRATVPKRVAAHAEADTNPGADAGEGALAARLMMYAAQMPMMMPPPPGTEDPAADVNRDDGADVVQRETDEDIDTARVPVPAAPAAGDTVQRAVGTVDDDVGEDRDPQHEHESPPDADEARDEMVPAHVGDAEAHDTRPVAAPGEPEQQRRPVRDELTLSQLSPRKAVSVSVSVSVQRGGGEEELGPAPAEDANFAGEDSAAGEGSRASASVEKKKAVVKATAQKNAKPNLNPERAGKKSGSETQAKKIVSTAAPTAVRGKQKEKETRRAMSQPPLPVVKKPVTIGHLARAPPVAAPAPAAATPVQDGAAAESVDVDVEMPMPSLDQAERDVSAEALPQLDPILESPARMGARSPSPRSNDAPLTLEELSPTKRVAAAAEVESRDVDLEMKEPAQARAPSPMRPSAKRPASATSTTASSGEGAGKKRSRVSEAPRVPSTAVLRGRAAAARGGARVVSAPTRVVLARKVRVEAEARRSLGGTSTAASRQRSVSAASTSAATSRPRSVSSRPESVASISTRPPWTLSGTETNTAANPITAAASSSQAPRYSTTGPKPYSIPDFAAMHASFAAQTALRRSQRHAAPTVPHAPLLSTDVRARERAAFDQAVREREALREQEREAERREREEREEEEAREARKRAVVKAHGVPEWYAAAPKRKEETQGGGAA